MQDGTHIITARDGSQYLLRRFPSGNTIAWRRPGPLAAWVAVKTWVGDGPGYECAMDTHGVTAYAIGPIGESYASNDAGATWAQSNTGDSYASTASDRDCWGARSLSQLDHCHRGGDGVTAGAFNDYGYDSDQDSYRNGLRAIARYRNVAGAGRFASAVLAEVWGTARPRLKPFVGRDADGRWRFGCHAPDAYREWRSTVPAWNATNTGTPGFAATWVDVSPGGAWPATIGNLDCVAWAEARDGSQLLAGYHLTAGAMVALSRGGWGIAWSGPYLSQAASDAAPYACCLPDGRVEVGWCGDDEATWTRYRAATPGGAWSAV